MKKIYITEDDDNIRNLMGIAMESFGYEIKTFEAAEDTLLEIEKEIPSLAIFDLMLSGIDGLTAIQLLREKPETKNLPIIILTAKDTELDKVQGLDKGADDYLTKPFSVLELSARVRSLLRRSVKSEEQNIITIRNLQIDTDTRDVKCSGQILELSYKEYELLKYLVDNKKRVVTRKELLSAVWGYEYEGETRTLDMHIRFLRQKLGEDTTPYIKTVRGVGYRFIEEE